MFSSYRVTIFCVEFDRRKRTDLHSGDVISGDVNLRHDDVIVVGVDVGKSAPYWIQPLAVNAPRSICKSTQNR